MEPAAAADAAAAVCAKRSDCHAAIVDPAYYVRFSGFLLYSLYILLYHYDRWPDFFSCTRFYARDVWHACVRVCIVNR